LFRTSRKETGTPKKQRLFFESLHKVGGLKEAKGRAGKFVIPGIGRIVKAHRKRAGPQSARLGGKRIKIKARRWYACVQRSVEGCDPEVVFFRED